MQITSCGYRTQQCLGQHVLSLSFCQPGRDFTSCHSTSTQHAMSLRGAMPIKLTRGNPICRALLIAVEHSCIVSFLAHTPH